MVTRCRQARVLPEPGAGRPALPVPDLGAGRHADALVLARQVFDEDAAGFATRTLADLVEAGVHAGDRRAAEAGLDRLTERALASGTPWSLGLLARARALTHTGADAEGFFQESLAC